MYQKFKIETVQYDFPKQYGYDWFCSAIDYLYEKTIPAVDWLGFEQFMRDVIQSKMSDDQKLRIINEGIGVFTRRDNAL